MIKKTIVVAPHPDDEILGVGGTLLRRKAEGVNIAWLIVSSASSRVRSASETEIQRSQEIEAIRQIIGFDEVYELNFPAAELDQVAMRDLVEGISTAFKAFEPDEVFLPHSSDVHTDHRVVFDAAISCTKWFRYPTVKRVLAYETLSETDFSLSPDSRFRPNVFVNIEPYLSQKLKALTIYSSEIGTFPFPRSLEAISALAKVRGAASGFLAAEAFELLRERVF
jgi:LmbE family N-acetylglucosaminyl deacetylase